MLALLSACSALRAAPGAARSVVPPRAVSPLMASWTADDMKFKRLKLPEEVRMHTAPHRRHPTCVRRATAPLAT